MKSAILLAIAAFALSACTHSIHVAHFSDFSPTYAAYQKGQMITAETEQFVILGFVTETSYVEKAYRELAAQCAGGRIQGIETQYSTDHGFLSWTNRIYMQGLCLKGAG
jgi:hypothetical protein